MTIEWRPVGKYVHITSNFSRAARDLLFQSLKMVYLTQKKENLPIYGIAKSKQLTDFCTS